MAANSNLSGLEQTMQSLRESNRKLSKLGKSSRRHDYKRGIVWKRR